MSCYSKIIKDTLQKPNGKWDKQALTFFAAFVMSIILGTVNTAVSYFSGIVNNPTADNIFNSFMFLTAALSRGSPMITSGLSSRIIVSKPLSAQRKYWFWWKASKSCSGFLSNRLTRMI